MGPRRPEEVIKEIPGSCSSTRRLMQPIDEMSCSSRHPDQTSRHSDQTSRHPDEMSGPCSSLSQDTHPTMDSTIGATFDSSGNQFFTLPTSSRLPVVTCGMGSLKKVKFVDENVVTDDNFERHSLPRSRKEKLHLCPMHKHKLTGTEQNKLETVAEAETAAADCGGFSEVDCGSRASRLSTLADVTCNHPPSGRQSP